MKILQLLAVLVILGVLSYVGIVWKSCHSLSLANTKQSHKETSVARVPEVKSPVDENLYSELEGYRTSGSTPDENKMYTWLIVSEPHATHSDVKGMSEGSERDVIVKAYEHTGLRLAQARSKADQFRLHHF
jgi:hypothetical protein